MAATADLVMVASSLSNGRDDCSQGQRRQQGHLGLQSLQVPAVVLDHFYAHAIRSHPAQVPIEGLAVQHLVAKRPIHHFDLHGLITTTTAADAANNARSVQRAGDVVTGFRGGDGLGCRRCIAQCSVLGLFSVELPGAGQRTESGGESLQGQLPPEEGLVHEVVVAGEHQVLQDGRRRGRVAWRPVGLREWVTLGE